MSAKSFCALATAVLKLSTAFCTAVLSNLSAFKASLTAFFASATSSESEIFGTTTVSTAVLTFSIAVLMSEAVPLSRASFNFPTVFVTSASPLSLLASAVFLPSVTASLRTPLTTSMSSCNCLRASSICFLVAVLSAVKPFNVSISFWIALVSSV